MIRLFPTLIVLALIFCLFITYQSMLFEQSTKKSSNANRGNAPSPQAIPINNGGAHSYFLPPRMETARYPIINYPLNMQTNMQVNTQVNMQADAQPTPSVSTSEAQIKMHGNNQDLLHSGYLSDTESSYKPAFGTSR